jgi:DNA repair photolyase
MISERQSAKPAKWLNPAGGYLSGYSHTLNPYVGCAFGCSFCYVRRMPVALFRSEPWGSWVNIKSFDRESFVKEWKRALSKGPVTVFMASATDPYQPAEYRHRVTRSLLSVMAEMPPAFVLLQTRSPLVLRDIDLLQQLGSAVRVSMTLESDLETVRKQFTPYAPPFAARRRALRELQRAGIAVQAAVSPLLPCSEQFAASLAESVPRIVVDDFFRGDGSGGKRTEQLRIRELYRQFGCEQDYSPETADRFYEQLQALVPAGRLLWSREGFLPSCPE